MSLVPTPKVSATEHEALLRLLEVAAASARESAARRPLVGKTAYFRLLGAPPYLRAR